VRFRSKIEELRVPGAIRVEFQPMMVIDGDSMKLYMLEALARGPRGSSLERPDVMFEYARRKGEEASIDMVCIAEALAAAATLPGEPSISMNIHGSTLGVVPQFARRFLDDASARGFVPSRLMLEIVEHRGPWLIDPMRYALHELREAGVKLAIDDLGVGSSNYELFIECRPDHIKIDRCLAHGATHDRYRRAVLESIVTLCRASDGTPIAEGIETMEDLETVRSLGIAHVQGWLFARSMPAEEIARIGTGTSPVLQDPGMTETTTATPRRTE
jgi:EAL domain-containing protein (putative c-di-GMP-specific phosphodiesterase class I)